MYEQKGLIKVFNGNKFKTVSYKNENGLITFTTSSKSNKYRELTKTHKIKVKEDGNIKEYDVLILEDIETVDKIFNELKSTKVIPFFIPRKDKIIVQYNI
ncbi:hypothetical protein SH2C18_28900 [Clostridium sediminicola]|uniref:hypothetical protein n=1 Tax=Clostridium sediminicola TaxID=3114879 RepID=UPI0031F231DF